MVVLAVACGDRFVRRNPLLPIGCYPTRTRAVCRP